MKRIAVFVSAMVIGYVLGYFSGYRNTAKTALSVMVKREAKLGIHDDAYMEMGNLSQSIEVFADEEYSRGVFRGMDETEMFVHGQVCQENHIKWACDAYQFDIEHKQQ